MKLEALNKPEYSQSMVKLVKIVRDLPLNSMMERIAMVSQLLGGLVQIELSISNHPEEYENSLITMVLANMDMGKNHYLKSVESNNDD